MGLNIWMKKFVSFVQIRIKRVSMKGMPWDFWGDDMCWRSSTAIGFCNGVVWDLARCLELDNLHRHRQPFHAIIFGFITTQVLNRQAHAFFEHFLGFFCNVFRVYLVYNLFLKNAKN